MSLIYHISVAVVHYPGRNVVISPLSSSGAGLLWHRHLVMQRDFALLLGGLLDRQRNLHGSLAPAAVVHGRLPLSQSGAHVVKHLAPAGHAFAALDFDLARAGDVVLHETVHEARISPLAQVAIISPKCG